jgi:hypothetical protein
VCRRLWRRGLELASRLTSPRASGPSARSYAGARTLRLLLQRLHSWRRPIQKSCLSRHCQDFHDPARHDDAALGNRQFKSSRRDHPGRYPSHWCRESALNPARATVGLGARYPAPCGRASHRYSDLKQQFRGVRPPRRSGSCRPRRSHVRGSRGGPSSAHPTSTRQWGSFTGPRPRVRPSTRWALPDRRSQLRLATSPRECTLALVR